MSAKQAVTKIIRIPLFISERDHQFKITHAIKFLEDGDTVKMYMHLKGRENAHKEKAEAELIKFVQDLTAYGQFQLPPIWEDNKLFLAVGADGGGGVKMLIL